MIPATAYNFQCECGAKYRRVHIRKPAEPHDRDAFCRCMARLLGRDGEFLLTYELIEAPEKPIAK
jgi:hypothetical protein